MMLQSQRCRALCLLHTCVAISLAACVAAGSARSSWGDDASLSVGSIAQGGGSLGRDAIVTPHYFGVETFVLNGPLELANGNTVAAEMVVYIKALRVDGGHTLRFKAQALLIDPLRKSLHQSSWAMANPPLAWVQDPSLPPRFYLKASRLGVKQEQEWDFEVDPASARVGHHKGTHPFTLHAEVPLAQLEGDGSDGPGAAVDELFFAVRGWWHAALLTRATMNVAVPRDRDNPAVPWGVFTVFTPSYGISPGWAGYLVAAHTRYHAHGLGFNGTVLYDRGTYLPHLSRDARVVPLAQQGLLRIVLWDAGTAGLPSVIDDPPPRLAHIAPYTAKYDQHVVYSYALLSHWGAKAYLYFVDFDEYLALPQGVGGIQALVAGRCTRTAWRRLRRRSAGRVAYMHTPRRNYVCGDGLPRADMARNTSLCPADLLAPLRLCTTASSAFVRGKLLADADIVVGHWTHSGTAVDGLPKSSRGTNPCGVRTIHFNDLQDALRRLDEGQVMQDTSWLWAVDAAVDAST